MNTKGTIIQLKKIFFSLGALVFRPVPGVIWGADSENDIG
jgi:hypothetical protein